MKKQHLENIGLYPYDIMYTLNQGLVVFHLASAFVTKRKSMCLGGLLPMKNKFGLSKAGVVLVSYA